MRHLLFSIETTLNLSKIYPIIRKRYSHKMEKQHANLTKKSEIIRNLIFFLHIFFNFKKLLFILHTNPSLPPSPSATSTFSIPISHPLLKVGKNFLGESTRSDIPTLDRTKFFPHPPFQGRAKYSTIGNGLQKVN